MFCFFFENRVFGRWSVVCGFRAAGCRCRWPERNHLVIREVRPTNEDRGSRRRSHPFCKLVVKSEFGLFRFDSRGSSCTQGLMWTTRITENSITTQHKKIQKRPTLNIDHSWFMNQIHYTRTKIEHVRSNMERASTQMTKHDSCWSFTDTSDHHQERRWTTKTHCGLLTNKIQLFTANLALTTQGQPFAIARHKSRGLQFPFMDTIYHVKTKIGDTPTQVITIVRQNSPHKN